MLQKPLKPELDHQDSVRPTRKIRSVDQQIVHARVRANRPLGYGIREGGEKLSAEAS